MVPSTHGTQTLLNLTQQMHIEYMRFLIFNEKDC